MKKEILNQEVRKKYEYLNKVCPNVNCGGIRSGVNLPYWFSSEITAETIGKCVPFIYDACKSPKTLDIASSNADIDLISAILRLTISRSPWAARKIHRGSLMMRQRSNDRRNRIDTSAREAKIIWPALGHMALKSSRDSVRFDCSFFFLTSLFLGLRVMTWSFILVRRLKPYVGFYPRSPQEMQAVAWIVIWNECSPRVNLLKIYKASSSTESLGAFEWCCMKSLWMHPRLSREWTDWCEIYMWSGRIYFDWLYYWIKMSTYWLTWFQSNNQGKREVKTRWTSLCYKTWWGFIHIEKSLTCKICIVALVEQTIFTIVTLKQAQQVPKKWLSHKDHR